MPSAFAKSDLGKLLFSKFTALLLITVLVMPMIVMSGIVNAKNERPRKAKPESVVKSAPPEPFVIGGKQTNSFQTNLTISLATALASSLSMFGISDQGKKEPQITTEKDDENGESQRSEKDKDESESNNSDEVETNVEAVPLPSPPAVPFDFDHDLKSDIGRFHAANYSYNIRKSDGRLHIPDDLALGSENGVSRNKCCRNIRDR